MAVSHCDDVHAVHVHHKVFAEATIQLTLTLTLIRLLEDCWKIVGRLLEDCLKSRRLGQVWQAYNVE